MKKHMKKVVSILLAVVMIFGISTTTSAVTPQYHSWVPKLPDLSNIELPDSVKEDIDDMVDDWLEDNPIEIAVLSKPTVTEAIYRHQRMFYDRARLQVRWNEIENAEYYKVKITTKDGEPKEYTTTNTSLFVYTGSDDFITGCIRSGSVQVMACSDTDGICDSAWSTSKTISCNSLHR